MERIDFLRLGFFEGDLEEKATRRGHKECHTNYKIHGTPGKKC